MSIPVLIITYERFDFVVQILKKLKSNNLSCVYITIDDYYRSGKSFDEVETYLKANEFEYQVLKWNKNIGCDSNIMEGIKWFFTHVNNGIILEDDCLPTDGLATFLKFLAAPNLANKSISLFSTNISGSDSFFLAQNYIPVFWGWYSNREYFTRFYKFYHSHCKLTKSVKGLWHKEMPMKSKIISLINFYAHRSAEQGVCWDSELALFQILDDSPFLVPSYSLISNLGFGDLGSKYTHTFKVPHWYCKVKFEGIDENLQEIPLGTSDYLGNNAFLNSFYANYSNNNIKLLFTLSKLYFMYRWKLIFKSL